MSGSDQYGWQDGQGGRYEDAYQNPDDPWTVRPGAPLNPYDQQQQQQVPTAPPRPSEPDWAALADSRSRGRRRRKRSYTTLAVVLAVAVVGGITALVLLSGGGSKAKTSSSKPGSTTSYTPANPSFRPAPTVPPAPSVDTVLADASLDTAPFTAQALFPSDTLTVNGNTYTVVARDTTTDCASAADSTLGPILRSNQCVQLVRATVTGPGGTAATIALAQFSTPAQAGSVLKGFKGGLKGLAGGPVTSLCPENSGIDCLRQADALDRYSLLVVAGYTNGKSVTPPAPAIDAAGTDLDAALHQALQARGQQISQQIYAHNQQAAEQAMNGTPGPSASR